MKWKIVISMMLSLVLSGIGAEMVAGEEDLYLGMFLVLVSGVVVAWGSAEQAFEEITNESFLEK